MNDLILQMRESFLTLGYLSHVQLEIRVFYIYLIFSLMLVVVAL